MIPAVAAAIVAGLTLVIEAVSAARERAAARKQLRPALIPLRVDRTRR